MGWKWWLKTRWKGDSRHKNGLNTDKNMANSSKHNSTAFEIQTRDECNPPPPPTQWASYMAILVQGCPVHQEQQKINALSCIYSYQKKRASSTDPGKPFIIALKHTILKLPSFSKVLGRFLLFTFFYPFSPSTLKYMCMSCRSCDDTLEKVCLFQYHLMKRKRV